jgi:hypothetical protein
MIDTNHWRFQRILQEAAAYRVLRDAIADEIFIPAGLALNCIAALKIVREKIIGEKESQNV